MGDDSSGRIARNALITTIVAIIMNPVSVGLGYYLNQELRKPRITIEYISDHYYGIQQTLDAKVSAAVVAEQDLIVNLRDTLTRRANERGAETCVDWLANASLWEDRCIPIVKEVSTGIAVILTAQSKKAPSVSAVAGVPSSYYRRQVLALQALVTEMKKMEAETNDAGHVKFKLGILNTGDADGIISNRATLKFDDKELWLATDVYVVAKSLSFQEVTFTIPDNDQNEAALAQWKNIVRDHVKSPFDFVLKTGDGIVVKKWQLK